MRAINISIAVVLVVLGLTACEAGKQKPETAPAETQPAPAKTGADMPAAPVTTEAKAAPAPLPPPSPAPEVAVPGKHSVQSTGRPPAPPKPAPAPAPETSDESESLIQGIDAYLSSLKTAAYTFNPPSPILVAKPVTVHFWLDPQATSAELAEELKKAIPRDAGRVESGQTLWSPKMRATLSGPDFEVKAVDPEEQPVSSTQRTTWSWDVTPLRAGEKLALHLRLAAVLPPELGPPKTITTLDREINVEVTWWWLFDHYFEKYWKWLLGGLGTAMVSAVAWWWKNKQAASKSA